MARRPYLLLRVAREFFKELLLQLTRVRFMYKTGYIMDSGVILLEKSHLFILKAWWLLTVVSFTCPLLVGLKWHLSRCTMLLCNFLNLLRCHLSSFFWLSCHLSSFYALLYYFIWINNCFRNYHIKRSLSTYQKKISQKRKKTLSKKKKSVLFQVLALYGCNLPIVLYVML